MIVAACGKRKPKGRSSRSPMRPGEPAALCSGLPAALVCFFVPRLVSLTVLVAHPRDTCCFLAGESNGGGLFDCAEKYSNFTVVETNDLMTSKLGLPSQSCECSSCGGTHLKQCDGHVGIVKLPATIFHPYFVQEIVQILNDICPGCKSLRQNPQNEILLCKCWSFSYPKKDLDNI
ncbi:hypothetical protein Taro_025743 [Colocasia esculenta]|uniref:DNA-directed RNA polymerase n=1 Tax=Colocasia esculenta TaxID=4460 RepID=A0A843VB13_COLES|nr:hypothetical protein [Colocasia esculenta]